MDDQTIGRRVRQAREEAGLSGRQLASAVGMDSGAYSRSEAGARAFKAAELIALADAMELPLDTLVRRPSAPQVEAVRRAGAAAERAGGEIATWIEAVNRSIVSMLDDPSIFTQVSDGASANALRVQFAGHVGGLLPDTRTITVLPGLSGLFTEVLREVLPGRFTFVEAAPGTEPEDEKRG